MIIRLIEVFKGINSETFTEILDLLFKGFAEAKIEPKTTCIYCNEEGVETHSYINGIKFPSHELCKQDAINKNEALKEAVANQPSSPAGYIGAVIGAIIGVIPYAIAVWFGWYVGLLAFITGTASYFGYKKFGGKVKKQTKFLVALISMVVILLSSVALMGIIAIQYDVTLAQVLSVSEIQAIFWESMAMSALFGGLGVAYVFSRIRKDEFNSDIK